MDDLTEKQMSDFKEVFEWFDRHKDGILKSSEVKEILNILGQNVTPEEVADIIHEFDLDDDGVINFNEFVHIMILQKEHEKEEAKIIFEAADKNKKGYLTSRELFSLMKFIGEDVTEKFVKEFVKSLPHIDNDKIYQEDFLRFVCG